MRGTAVPTSSVIDHNARLAADPRYRMAFKQAMDIRRSRRQAIKAAAKIAEMLASWKREQSPPHRIYEGRCPILPLYRMGAW